MSNVVFFDGVNDTIQIMHSASLNISGPITISIRLKTPTSAIGGNIVVGAAFSLVKSNGAAYRYGIYMDTVNKQFSLYLRLTINGVKTVSTVAGNPNPRDGLWHYITGSFDGRYLRIYVDGNLVATTDAGSADTITTDVGDIFLNTWATSAIFNAGWMGEIQIYNRQLSDSEVLYNFMHPGNPIKRGIQLNLTQDSIYGTQWQDLSGNGNHGTYTGGALPMKANNLAGR